MAVESVCVRLAQGFDASCDSPVRKYYQQAVIINKSDIEQYDITKPDPVNGDCEYNVTFNLKVGKTGYKFIGPERGSNFFGSYDKSTSDLGFPQYLHSTQILIVGVTEASKCILDSLDKGTFVVALQLTDGTVEIYGVSNGVTTGDYTYNLQEGGGGTPVLLTSLETSPENCLPLVYKPEEGGDASADFDANFENPVV